jgi:heptosyltransferase-2
MWTTKKPIELGEIKKILVIQFRPFGDVFITSALFEPLRKAFPKAKLCLLLMEPYLSAVEGHPFIDEFITIPRPKGVKYFTTRLQLFYRIWAMKFDVVIDVQNQSGTQQVVFFSGAKYRIGNHKGQFSFVYNYKVKVNSELYAAVHRLELLQPLGIVNPEVKYYMPIKDESRHYINEWLKGVGLHEKEFVIISPSSPVEWKKWSLNNYATTSDMINDEIGLPVVLLWAKNELSDCEKLINLTKNKPILAPQTNLNQALALLEKGKLLICNDGGLNHISCAVGIQTIALFGKLNPSNWSPASVFSHHHHLHNPDFPSDKDFTFGITPEEVMEKVRGNMKYEV